MGSFRWADVTQGFIVTYDGIDFPIGATARWDVTDHVYLIGGAETFLLHSNTSISLDETSGSVSIVDVADTYSQVLRVLGALAGGGVQLGDLTVEIGYEMQAWFDLGDRRGFLED